MSELRRLIIRHRHVAPMVSALLAGTGADVTIRDADGEVVLKRGGGADAAGSPPGERHPVEVDGDVLGWVEGGRPARGIAAVLAYAAARERDERSLANEALERYRELSPIYDLAAIIGGPDGGGRGGARPQLRPSAAGSWYLRVIPSGTCWPLGSSPPRGAHLAVTVSAGIRDEVDAQVVCVPRHHLPGHDRGRVRVRRRRQALVARIATGHREPGPPGAHPAA